MLSESQSLSLRFFETLNLTLLDALMVMGAPVAGFRPWRSGRSEIMNVPKLGTEIFSPSASNSPVFSKIESIHHRHVGLGYTGQFRDPINEIRFSCHILISSCPVH